MAHEVYICYNEKDQAIADDICTALEENSIKCWFKARDLGVGHLMDEIITAISCSELMILVFSKNVQDSHFVNTEVDIAFSEDLQILIYKIDESPLEGSLGFFLQNKACLDVSENPKDNIELLLNETYKLLGR